MCQLKTFPFVLSGVEIELYFMLHKYHAPSIFGVKKRIMILKNNFIHEEL